MRRWSPTRSPGCPPPPGPGADPHPPGAVPATATGPWPARRRKSFKPVVFLVEHDRAGGDHARGPRAEQRRRADHRSASLDVLLDALAAAPGPRPAELIL